MARKTNGLVEVMGIFGHGRISGFHHSEETKKRISVARIGQKSSQETKLKISEAGKGRRHSDETKRKIGDGNKGKIVSLETRNKIRNANKGQVPWNKGKINCYTEEQKQRMRDTHSTYWRGKHLSEEHRMKIIKSHIGHSVSLETKRKISAAHIGMTFPRGRENKNWKGGARASWRRVSSRRKNLGFKEINPEYREASNFDAHHLDYEHVIYIPRKIHKAIYHRLDKPETIERINTKAYCWVLGVG